MNPVLGQLPTILMALLARRHSATTRPDSPSSPASRRVTGAPNMRLVQTLCERVERGTVDLVVVYTAFATHKATQRLKKSLQRAPEARALWVSGVPSARNLRDALLEHPEAHLRSRP